MDFITSKSPKYLSVLIALTFLCLGGCTPRKGIPEDVLDTPQHHVSSGFKLLKKDYLFHAEREFKLALQLDPQSWNAHRGLGLVYAEKNEFSPALAHMQMAGAGAQTDEARALVDVGFMRIYIRQDTEGWFDKVRQRYADALSHDPALAEAHYYMGVAFQKENRLTEARGAFKKVVDLDKGLVTEARQELQAIDRMEKGE
ncbi:MAG: tetratricopeptide repeat protein [Thermodesulfobacteriota bacterium]